MCIVEDVVGRFRRGDWVLRGVSIKVCCENIWWYSCFV